MVLNWSIKNRENELFILRKIIRKVNGEHASVFLEFAFIMPILLTFSLFLLELCLFWDATVMGNHAAFTIARVAKVHIYHGRDTTADFPYPNVTIGNGTYSADKVITAFFMMTSTFSWIDTPSNGGDIDFVDFLSVKKNIFQVEMPSDANGLEKMLGGILTDGADIANNWINSSFNTEGEKELTAIFNDSHFKTALTQRFYMAMQRADAGCIKTEQTVFADHLDFPSDDALLGDDGHPSGNYDSPEIVKISINYLLHKGGWFYNIFTTKSDNDINSGRPVALGRCAMLVEPAKRNLKDYEAKDDGKPSHPKDQRKAAKKRAKKIIADTSTILDKWRAAVIKRSSLEKNKKKHQKKYNKAIKKEHKLWATIVKKIDSFNKLINKKLCTTTRACLVDSNYINCVKKEYKEIDYCDKVARKIIRTSDEYNVWKVVIKTQTHYVNRKYAYPSHCLTNFCDKDPK